MEGLITIALAILVVALVVSLLLKAAKMIIRLIFSLAVLAVLAYFVVVYLL